MNPTFSIILPCYNVVPYLKTCLDSIFKNNMSGNELILINDGSTDSFQQFCSRYFAIRVSSDYIENEYKGCNVIIISQSNHGVSYTRNRGIEAAAREYCLFVDPDDNVSYNWLTKISSALKIQSYDMLLFGYLESKVDAQGEIISTQTVLPLQNYTIHTREEAIAQLLSKYLGKSMQDVLSWAKGKDLAAEMEHHSVWRISYKRSFLIKNHLRFPEKIILNEDGIFNANCIAHATSIGTIMKPLYHYYVRTSGAYNGKAREGKCMVDNKLSLLNERVKLLERLEREHFDVEMSMISGSTILSIFEMLLKAPDHYTYIKSEYITHPKVSHMINQMPYVHKFTFDMPLLLLKHKCLSILRILFSIARPLKASISNRRENR